MSKKQQKPDFEIERLLSAGKIKAILCAPKRRGFLPEQKAEVILFDDGETYIVLSEQDYYDYNDCSISARQISVMQNKEAWESYVRDYVPAMRLT